MPRARPYTEMYLDAVEQAVAEPGQWIEIPRRFKTEFNAAKTGSCLQSGYLRVQPRDGDMSVTVSGKRYIRTSAPVTPKVDKEDAAWKLSVRFSV